MNEQPAFPEDLDLACQAFKGNSLARKQLAKRLRCVPNFVAARNVSLGRPLHGDEIDDLVQDVVTAVWKKIDRYRGEAPFEGWVYRFSILEFKSHMRRKIHRETHSKTLPTVSEEQAIQEEPGVDLYEDVYKGLNKIGIDYAQIIRLKHFSQLTFEEIANRLRVSMNTVKTRYYRGLVKLRQCLDPQRARERQ